jgi:hypothetical protein
MIAIVRGFFSNCRDCLGGQASASGAMHKQAA